MNGIKGITGEIEHLYRLTNSPVPVPVLNSRLFASNCHDSSYICSRSDDYEYTYYGSSRCIDTLYTYRYDSIFFICVEISSKKKFMQFKNNNDDVADRMNGDYRYYIIHPRSTNILPVNMLPKEIGYDTRGNIIFSSGESLHKTLGIFDTNNSSFIRDKEQLEPASEDDMQEFKEGDKMKKLIDETDDDDIIINKKDIFDSVPSKDLREAHNDETLEQYIEKMFTSSSLDKEDIMTIVPGFGKCFNDSRPSTDLREEHLEFMESNEYRKILEHSKKVMESNGENPEDVKKLQQISRDLEVIESSSSIKSSDVDIRDVETLKQFSNEIREAKESVEERNDNQNEKNNRFI